MLAAGTRRAECINAEVFHVQRKIHFLGLGHYGYRCRGGVNAALRLRFRHSLHSVDTALVFEAVVGAPPVHRDDGLFHAAQLGLVEVEHFPLPAPALDVHAVHPHQAVGKQGRFLAAGSAAQLQNHAFFVICILGQQQNFEIIFQLRHILTLFADFLLYHFLKVRVEGLPLQQGFGLFQMIFGGSQLPVGVHHRLQLVVLLHQAAEQRRVCSRFRLVQADGKLLKPVADRLHLGKQFWHIGQFSLQQFPNVLTAARRYTVPGLMTFLMFFSIFARGSMTSRPQPVQRILKSMPTRSTSKLAAPQGCFLRVRMVSPTAMSISVSLLLVQSGTGRMGGAQPHAYRYSINQTRAKCKYLLPAAHMVYQPGATSRTAGKTQEKEE